MEKANSYPELSVPVLILFNFYNIIWWLEVGKRNQIFDSIRLEFLLGAVLGIIALNKALSEKGSESNRDITFAILLFISVLFVSIPFSLNADIAWRMFVDRVLKFAAMSLFISQFVVSPLSLKLYCFSSFFAFLKIGQESFHGKVTGNMVWENQGIPRLHGAQGTMFGHPNSLSGKTLSLFPFLWYLWPTVKKKWVNSLIILQFIFSINILIFTGSRTGYLSFILMLFFIFLDQKKKLKILVLFIFFVIIAVNFLPEAYVGRFLSTFSDDTQVEGQGSKDARKNLFKDSVRVFLQKPLGVGLACFPEAQRKAGRNAQMTHNLYTQVLAETGIQGTVCFIILLTVLLKKIIYLKREFENSISKISGFMETLQSEGKNQLQEELTNNQFFSAIAKSLHLFLIVRLLLGIFGHDLLEIYWWIMAGLTMSLSKLLELSRSRIDELIKSNSEKYYIKPNQTVGFTDTVQKVTGFTSA